jgi:hypothetical protein
MEIVYCAGCQIRVTGVDLDQGRAFRSGDRVLCRACAPAELSAAAAKVPAPSGRPGSSTSLPKMATTRRATLPAAAPRRPGALLVGGIVGAVLLILALAALLSGRPEPAPPTPGPPPAPIPAPPRDTGQEKRRAAEWSSIESQSKQACEREEFGRAVGLLESAIRGSSDPDWNWMVNKRLTDVRIQAKTLFADLSARASTAKNKGADAEAALLAARVAAWKLPECVIVFEEKPPPAPPPVPAPAPASGPAPLVIFDERLQPGWRDWSYSTQRNFEARASGAEGRNSLGVVFERIGAGLYFHSEKLLDGTRYAALEFSCRAEGEPQSIVVTLSDEKNGSLGSVSLGKLGGHPPVGAWKRYEIPISMLHGEGRKISGFTIQAVGKVPATPVYFDKILLRPAP